MTPPPTASTTSHDQSNHSKLELVIDTLRVMRKQEQDEGYAVCDYLSRVGVQHEQKQQHELTTTTAATTRENINHSNNHNNNNRSSCCHLEKSHARNAVIADSADNDGDIIQCDGVEMRDDEDDHAALGGTRRNSVQSQHDQDHHHHHHPVSNHDNSNNNINDHEMESCDDDDNDDDSIDASARSKMIEWCDQVASVCQYDKEMVHMAVAYMDRFLSIPQIGTMACQHASTFQLVVLTCLYIAAKLHPIEALEPSTLAMMSRGAFTVEQVTTMERTILMALQWRMNPPTATVFLDAILLFMQCDDNNNDDNNNDDNNNDENNNMTKKLQHQLAHHYVELGIRTYPLAISVKPSILAMAALKNAMEDVPTANNNNHNRFCMKNRKRRNSDNSLFNYQSPRSSCGGVVHSVPDIDDNCNVWNILSNVGLDWTVEERELVESTRAQLRLLTSATTIINNFTTFATTTTIRQRPPLYPTTRGTTTTSSSVSSSSSSSTLEVSSSATSSPTYDSDFSSTSSKGLLLQHHVHHYPTTSPSSSSSREHPHHHRHHDSPRSILKGTTTTTTKPTMTMANHV